MKRILLLAMAAAMLFSCWVVPAQGDAGADAPIMLCDCNNPDQFGVFGAIGPTLESRITNGSRSDYVTFQVRAFDFAALWTAFSPVDVSRYQPSQLGLRFTLYVSSRDGLIDPGTGKASGSVELSTAGDSLEHGYSWSLEDYKIEEGFQELCFPLSAATVTGIPDLSSLNYFRVYFDSADEVRFGLDNIEIVTVASAGYSNAFSSSAEVDAWSVGAGARLSFGNPGMILSAGSGVTTLRLQDSALASFEAPDTVVQLILSGWTTGLESVSVRIGNQAAARYASFEFSGEGVAQTGITILSRQWNEASAVDAPFELYTADTAEIVLHANEAIQLEIMSFSMGDRCSVMEHQIAAIGPVTSGNYPAAGKKIEAAEQGLTDLMEQMGFTEADASDYVSNYFVLADARSEYNRYLSEKEKGVCTDLTASQSTLAPGDTVEVQYRVQNLLDTDGSYSYEIAYSMLYATASEDSAPTQGTVSIAAGSETILRLCFTAREGGILRVKAKLRNDKKRLLSQTTVDVQITGAGCYLGTTHSHSTESDGKGTLAQNYHRMVQDGMSLTYSTDHNAKVSDPSNLYRALEAMSSCGYRFLALKGTEITVYGNNGHMLSYGNNIDFTEPPRLRTQEAIDNWNKIIDTINQAGGYSYLAHPFNCWYNYPGFAADSEKIDPGVEFYDDILDLYTEMTGIEIINVSYNASLANNDRAIAYWNRMNCKGHKKYFGSGGSDGHVLDDLSLTYDGFLMDELTTESFVDAHRNGRFFVTTGPEMRFTLGGKTFGQTLLADSGLSRLSVEAYTGTGYLTEVTLYDYPIDPTNPEGAYDRVTQTALYQYEQGGEQLNYFCCDQDVEVLDGHFYRIEVHANDRAKVALSNPVWVFDDQRGDINGDGAINASDALEALQYSVGLISLELRENEMADVDGSGRIDASDALKILQKSVGLIESFS